MAEEFLPREVHRVDPIPAFQGPPARPLNGRVGPKPDFEFACKKTVPGVDSAQPPRYFYFTVATRPGVVSWIDCDEKDSCTHPFR